MKLEFHPEAEEEFLESVSRYEAEVPGLGQRFDAEVQKASALLLECPEIGPPVDDVLRKLLLDRFPYYPMKCFPNLREKPNFRSSGRAGSAVPQLLSVAARRSPRRLGELA